MKIRYPPPLNPATGSRINKLSALLLFCDRLCPHFDIPDAFHDRGFRVYVATTDGDLAPDDLAAESKAAIVFGNEHAGVRQEVTQRADGTYSVPMKGFVQSLNVSVATAITLHAATRGRPGDLTASERTLLRARFMMLSVRHAEQIVLDHLRRDER